MTRTSDLRRKWKFRHFDGDEVKSTRTLSITPEKINDQQCYHIDHDFSNGGQETIAVENCLITSHREYWWGGSSMTFMAGGMFVETADNGSEQSEEGGYNPVQSVVHHHPAYANIFRFSKL